MHTSPKCVFRFCFLLCVSYVTGDNQDKTRNRREMHKTKIRISSSKKFGRNRRRTLKLEVSESENANFFLLCSRSCAFRSFRVHLLLLIGFSSLFFFFWNRKFIFIVFGVSTTLLDMPAGAMHANECVLCISDEIVFVSVVFPLRPPQPKHRNRKNWNCFVWQQPAKKWKNV